MGLFYCFNVRLYVFLQAKNWLLKAAVESAYLSAILTYKKGSKTGKYQKGLIFIQLSCIINNCVAGLDVQSC